MPKRGQTCKCGHHVWNGKRWELAVKKEARDYIRELFNIRDAQRDTTEEARLIAKLWDGRLENLIRLALEEIRQ